MQSRFGGAYGPYGDFTDELELDTADDEPELGSLDAQVSQLSWAKGRDGEPSLGSMDNYINQPALGVLRRR